MIKKTKTSLILIINFFFYCLFLLPLQAQEEMIQGSNSDMTTTAVQWSNRGIELFEQGDYEKAIQYLYEAWKLDDKYSVDYAKNLSVAYNNYASILGEKGKLDESLKLIQKAIFFDEENETSQKNLDLVYKNKGLNPNDFNLRIKQAHSLRSEGYIEEAIAEYKKALQLKIKDPKESLKIKLELAQIYQILYGKYIESPVKTNFFNKMLALVKEINIADPKDYKPHLLLGRAYLTSNSLAEAIESFENVLKLSPDNQEALNSLVVSWKKVVDIAPKEANNLIGYGSALAKAGRIFDAKIYLDRAKNLKPSLATEIDEILKQSNSSSALNTANIGYEEQKKGDNKTAIANYKKALMEIPPGPEASDIFYNMGLAYQNENDIINAENAFKQALKMNPTNTGAIEALNKLNKQKQSQKIEILKKAISLQEQGNLKEAIDLYKKVLAFMPEDSQTHFNLGTAYQANNQLKESLYEYKKALSLNPENLDYKDAVQSLEHALNNGAGNLAESNKLVKEALKLQSQAKTTEAIQKYRQAIELSQNNAQAHFNLATILHGLKKEQEAIREYEEAYRLDSNNYSEAKFFIGNLLENLGNLNQALANYRIYLEQNPDGDYALQTRERIKFINRSYP